MVKILDENLKIKIECCPKCESDDLERLSQWNEFNNSKSFIKYQCRMNDCLHVFVVENDEYFSNEEIFDTIPRTYPLKGH